MIVARNLAKVFRTPKRMSGRLGALRTLITRRYTDRIAVADVSFEIEAGS